MTELDRQREGGIEADEDRQLEQHRHAAGKGVHMMPAVEFHDLLLECDLVVLEALPKLCHLRLNLLHFPHVTECRLREGRGRSEEHTSELQSPCNLVCRLLLEKKKKEKTAAPAV